VTEAFEKLMCLDFLEREKRILGFPVTLNELNFVASLTLGQQSKSEVSLVRGESDETYDQNILELVWKAVEGLKDFPRFQLLGKRVLVKPNLIEARKPHENVTTHPSVVRAVVRIVKELGAREVVIVEGSGHEKDSYLLFKNTGMCEVANEENVKLVDLNSNDVVKFKVPKPLTLPYLFVPRIIKEADIIISIPKLKTHHWACVTLSLKNMLGIAPGSIYGFPKNRLHWACIPKAVADINSVVNLDLIIVDGIIAMEGNGPLDGQSVNTNVILASHDRLAVDSLATYSMGFSPILVPTFQWAFKKKIGCLEFEGVEQTPSNFMHKFKAPPNLRWLEGKGFYSKEKLRDYILGDYTRDIDRWIHKN